MHIYIDVLYRHSVYVYNTFHCHVVCTFTAIGDTAFHHRYGVDLPHMTNSCYLPATALRGNGT